MLDYFAPTLMVVLTSNLIIIIIALCFQRKKILFSVGYNILILFLLLTLVRLILPFELPITKNIYLPEFLSKIITYFIHPFYRRQEINISPWILFECAWAVGVIIQLLRYIYEVRKFDYFVTMWSIDVTDEDPYSPLLSEVCGERKDKFRVLKVPDISSPALYGIVKPRILLPEKMTLTNDDIYYTFRHEVSHHYHRDLVVKHIVNLLAILYWWNPACYVLRNQVNLLLEMRIDDSLVKGDKDTTLAYLAALIRIAQEAKKSSHPSPDITMTFTEKNSHILEPRFEMMCNREPRANLLVSTVLSVIIISIYLGSYLVTFENSYTVESEVEGTFGSVNDMYAILREDGTYDIYYTDSEYGDIFVENRESLEYIPGIPIFNQEP